MACYRPSGFHAALWTIWLGCAAFAACKFVAMALYRALRSAPCAFPQQRMRTSQCCTIGLCLYRNPSDIVLVFFAQPVERWVTVQDFSAARRAIPIAVHWVGGTVILLVGPLQLFESLRSKRPAVHRWNGRLYLIGVLAASGGGLSYLALNSSIGGTQMDVNFAIYGILLAACATMAYLKARSRKFVQHSEWAIRTFALGTGSALYRVLVFPLFVELVPSGDMSHQAKVDWLTDAGWVFWPVPMVLAELYIRRRRWRVLQLSGSAYSHASSDTRRLLSQPQK